MCALVTGVQTCALPIYLARYLRALGRSAHLLPALCPRGQRQARPLASHLPRPVPRRTGPHPDPRPGRPQCPAVGLADTGLSPYPTPPGGWHYAIGALPTGPRNVPPPGPGLPPPPPDRPTPAVPPRA